ncbi:alpha/beta fold hydrolase [Undibacterium sp.]|uniref:alpha/beta fold hydrolase n=1 Tax=Undibacterium sp. TaxID=1914977 RepID=UPI0025ED9C30|nr:alpha/beta fold hydrolase [Undibacterium sp.]
MQKLFFITRPLLKLLCGLTLSWSLAGCVSVENTLSSWAINGERALASVQKKHISVGEFELSYLEGGQGDTVFLIHGFESNKDIWIRFAAQLTQHYHVIAIDLPGHGDSTILMTQSYSVPEQAQRVIALMDALHLMQPVHLLGHSMGGAIAYQVAAIAPQRVKSLGLMSAAGVVSGRPSELFMRLQHGENPLIAHDTQSFKDLLAFTMSDPPYIPGPVIASLTRTAIAREAIASKIFTEIRPPYSRELETLQAKISMPTLLIWGDKDRAVDVSSTEVFKRLIPQAQLVIFKDIGHAPQLERTKETAIAYQAFLAGIKQN